MSKAPRIDRPKVSRGISAEEFANWEKRYELWKSASSVKDDPSQLIACCDMELESALISYYSDIAEQPEAEVLKRIKQLAVLDVASTVKVTELLNLKQQHGESARSYTARLRGKYDGNYELLCGCTGRHDANKDSDGGPRWRTSY